jgi:phosphatidylglycerophosphatase A
MNFTRHPIVFLATGAWIGFAPKAPGTLGSLWGLPMAWILSRIPLSYAVIWVLIFALITIWVSGSAEKYFQKKDPGCIVIDEILGLVIGLLGFSFNAFTAITGFILFRIFDIFKPFPVRWIEKHLNGGWGVALDDVAAGIYTNILLHIILIPTY